MASARSTASARRALRAAMTATALLLVVLVLPAAGYPALFVQNGFANGCTDHPSGPLGVHGAPKADKETTFTVTEAGGGGGGAPVAALCPGVAYRVAVGYPQRRRTLLTASQGAFGAGADAACPNRAISAGADAAYADTLTLPCGAKGASVALRATSAARASDAFHDAAATLPLRPVAECPSSTCPGAPAAAAKQAAAPAAAKPAAPATAAAAAAAAAAAPVAADGGRDQDDPSKGGSSSSSRLTNGTTNGTSSGGGAHGSSKKPGCDASAYGYACAVPAGGGATLHFTKGGAPPPNACTATARAAGAAAAAGPEMLHFLLDAPAAGYAGLAFPRTAGVMSPADAVIGYVDGASGAPVVGAHHLTSYRVDDGAPANDGGGWAKAMGAARPAGQPGRTLLCLSRAADAAAAPVMKALDARAVSLNWAADASTRFAPHALEGSVTVNAAEGGASGASGGDGRAAAKARAAVAHGAIMLAAFGFVMPGAALLARHKWVFGRKNVPLGGIGGAWYTLHRAAQGSALLAAVAAFIVALVVFDVPWSPGAATPSALYDPHRALGVVVVALTVVQAVAGVSRPNLMGRARLAWRAGHQGLGWLTIAVGAAVCFLGAALMHELHGAAWADWMAPLAACLGALAAAGVALELVKRRLQAKGIYEPSRHGFDAVSGRAGEAKAQALAAMAEHAASRKGLGGSGKLPYASSSSSNGRQAAATAAPSDATAAAGTNGHSAV